MRVYSNPNLAMVGHFKNILESYGIACILDPLSM